jgi:indoleamine 2,3-dioxygenase
LGENPQAWQRAFLVLSLLTSAYVWGRHQCHPVPSINDSEASATWENEEEASVVRVVPPALAIPFAQVAMKLGLRPIVCYAGIDLWNWQLVDEALPMTLDNIMTLNIFSGTLDESWFFLVPVGIEIEGAPALPLMVEAWHCVLENNPLKLAQLLRDLHPTIKRMGAILRRMHDRCDPYVFYNQIRPYVAGWSLAEGGIVFSGVDPDSVPASWFMASGTPEPIKEQVRQGHFPKEDGSSVFFFAGGSAAQSSLIQALDVFLGVEHHVTGHGPAASRTSSALNSGSEKPPAKKKMGFIHEMREYMPENHRRFLHDAEHVAPSVRNYVLENSAMYPDLVSAYNQAVDAVGWFRDLHLQIVARFILMQAGKNQKQNQPLSPPNMPMIKKPRLDSESSAAPPASSAPSRKYTKSTLTEHNPTTGEKGTGGTSLMPFLKQARDETKLSRVDHFELARID